MNDNQTNAPTENTDEREDFLERIAANPLATVATYYASCLKESAKALAFLTDELGLTIEQATEQHMGFSDRTLGKLLPSKRLKAGREIGERLQSLGLYKANGRETLRGYVTMPIVDDTGDVIGIRGHKMDKHASGPETILVGVENSTTKDTNHTKDNVGKVAKTFDEQPAEKPVKMELLASPATTSPAMTKVNELVIEGSEIIFTRDDRRYRIRGLEKNNSLMQLKINLMVSRDELVHLDTLDLVKARSRASFIKAAATELYVDADTIKKDIGTMLLQLETLNSDRIAELKKPKSVEVSMTDEEHAAALELLRDENLLQRIVADMDACGIVGESTNKLAGYLAATSRKLDKPLAVVIQSSSSAGKTSLMDAVLSMMPEEDVQRFSGMTGQSLFYLESDQIRHKVLAIAEDDGIKEATYALKLLQSEGELRHATVGRGEDGRPATQENKVEGPVQIFLTSTAMDIDEELLNRCFVLTVDETDGQTDAIQSKQRETFTSQFTDDGYATSQIRKLHQNAQRLLQPIQVFNPYAPQLTFPTHKTRMRRDHVKYLTLINTITFLHQHQRTKHNGVYEGKTVQFINVERHDIAVANGIAGEVLGRSLDELSPQTRTLLGLLHEFVDDEVKSLSVPRSSYRFTRRDVRESIHWSDSQVRNHLSRLVELEYVLVHRGRNGQRYVYELLYSGEGREGQPFLMGLLDPAKLTQPASTTKTLTPPATTLTPSTR